MPSRCGSTPQGGGRGTCACREPYPPSSGDHLGLVEEATQTIGSWHLGGIYVLDRSGS